MLHKCLSIAGFDGSGGAGLQADLKTFSALGCYGMTVLTAIPVQNTMGVKKCYEIPLSAIYEQLEAIFEDITPDSIKIGMLFNKEIVELVADFLKAHAKNIPIVLDPVMVAKSGDYLLKPDAVESLKEHLLPIATIITPNLPEAYALTNINNDQEAQALSLLNLGANAILLKGGHLDGTQSNDLFMDKTKKAIWFKSPRINSKNTHGTGCTLSAAIAANLALGKPLIESCGLAKEYLFNALESARVLSVGLGAGPVNHFYNLWQNDASCG